MQSKAKTVKQYLAELPADRRKELEAVRKVILANLDDGYEEGMCYGAISYFVPHSLFPAGYHCDPSKPLVYAGLASQKQYLAVYLMCVYGSPEIKKSFEAAWRKTGKKLDMGKSCIRFKRAEDAALDAIGEAIRRVPAKKYIEHYESVLGERATKRPKAAAKSGVKKVRASR